MTLQKVGRTQQKVTFQWLTAEFLWELCWMKYADGAFGRPLVGEVCSPKDRAYARQGRSIISRAGLQKQWSRGAANEIQCLNVKCHDVRSCRLNSLSKGKLRDGLKEGCLTHKKNAAQFFSKALAEDFSILLRKAQQDGYKLKLDKMNPERRCGLLAGRKGIIYQGMW